MPEVAEPDVLEPAVLEPAVLEPAVLEPAVFEPDVLEPDVFEPDVLEPEVFEPEPDEPDVVAVVVPESVEPVLPLLSVAESSFDELHALSITVLVSRHKTHRERLNSRTVTGLNMPCGSITIAQQQFSIQDNRHQPASMCVWYRPIWL